MSERWRTVLAIDHDARACEVYRANFAGVEVRCGNVADEIESLPNADVVLGGFPCQPHSMAGKRGASADDRDGGPDFVAAIAKVRPRMFLGENVDGILSSEGGRYIHRLVRSMEATGYVVEVKQLDAVDFGTPQFRSRVFFWGIRKDIYGAVMHQWPRRTHMDPAKRGALFGEDLPAWVTCGEALGLTVYDAQNDATIDASRPCGTIQGNAQEKGGGAGHYAVHRARAESVDRRDHPVGEPSPTLADGSGGSGGILQLAVQSHAGTADPADPAGLARPAPSLRSGGAGHDGCCVRLEAKDYPWSEEMYAKHPPAQPAQPAQTILGKFYKGGAEGLVEQPSADGRPWDSRHPAASAPSPAPAVRARSPRDGGRCTENVLSGEGLPNLPTHTIFGEPVKWIRKGDKWMRRLSQRECARLQGVPDDFVWPAGVSKSAMYRIIGNGWSCAVAKALSECFAVADPESRTVIDLYCGGGLGACGWHGRAWRERGMA